MHFPLSPVDITMNMTPWFHRGGIHSGGPTPTLYAGACLVIMRTFNPRSCMDFIEKYGITFITGVPSTLEMLANRQEKHQKNLSSLKGIITMGSPLEKAACIRYQELLSPTFLTATAQRNLSGIHFFVRMTFLKWQVRQADHAQMMR